MEWNVPRYTPPAPNLHCGNGGGPALHHQCLFPSRRAPKPRRALRAQTNQKLSRPSQLLSSLPLRRERGALNELRELFKYECITTFTN